jgi:hypothetical protein
LLFSDHMRRRAPEVDSEFQNSAGMNLEDYFTMLVQIAADSVSKSPDGLRDPSKSGLFDYRAAHEPMATLAKAFPRAGGAVGG